MLFNQPQLNPKNGAQARKGTEPRPPCAAVDYLFLNFCFFCFKTKEKGKTFHSPFITEQQNNSSFPNLPAKSP